MPNGFDWLFQSNEPKEEKESLIPPMILN